MMDNLVRKEWVGARHGNKRFLALKCIITRPNLYPTCLVFFLFYCCAGNVVL